MSVKTHDNKEGVLFLTAAFPGPSEPSRAVSLANAAQLLSEHFDVTVLAPHVYLADPQRERLPYCEVVRFPYHTGGKILKHYTYVPVLRLVSYFFSGLATALRIIRRKNIRVVYANWVLPAGLIGVVASRLYKIPLVVHAHGSDINVYARKNPLFRFLARLVLDNSDRVLAVGHDLLASIHAGFHMPSWKTAYSPPVIDAAVFSPGSERKARSELGLPQKEIIVLFVGDLTSAKGADLFFDAASQISEEIPGVRFIMLGNGPLYPRLIKKNKSRDSLLFPGAVANEKVAVYMRAADLLVLPSFTEGRPVSVLEAMHVGLPVLATKVGDLPDLITDGENGILIEPGDKESLAAELRRILTHPDLLSRLGKRMQRLRTAGSSVLPGILKDVLSGPDYDRYWRGARASHFRRRARERAGAALSLLPLREGAVLDAGCGRGELLETLRGCGFRAEGVDISHAAVKEAGQKGLSAQILDIEKGVLRKRYDAVFCLELLEHLRRPEKVIKKLSDALNPGGYLVVSLPNEKNLYHGLRNFVAHNRAHLHLFSHRKALDLFASAGLTVKRRQPLPLLPLLPGLGLIRKAFCRFWPGAFAISNIYLLRTPGGKVD